MKPRVVPHTHPSAKGRKGVRVWLPPFVSYTIQRPRFTCWQATLAYFSVGKCRVLVIIYSLAESLNFDPKRNLTLVLRFCFFNA